MLRRNFSDSISSIIKSIEPIHYAYSKQNKDLNKYFLTINLNVINFIRTLDQLSGTKTNFYHNDKKNKKSKTNRYMFDEDIKKTINRLERMNYNKYLPRTIYNKININNNTNNNEEEEEISEKDRKKEEDKINKLKILTKLDDKYYNGITLDPGRYDPKYNLIFKRTKDIFIGTAKKYYINNNIEKTKESSNNKKNITNISNIKSLKNKANIINYKKLIIKKKENNKKYFISNNKTNKNNTFDKNNFKTTRLSSKSGRNNFRQKIFNFNSNIQTRTISPKIKSSSLISLNKTLNKNDFNEIKNKKIFSAKIKNINIDLEHKNEDEEEEEQNKEKNRCSSSLGFNNKIFSFDKMMGRNPNLFIIKQNTKNEYTPKYDITRPYMYVKKFTNATSLQGFKKFAVSKIIRHYQFSPKDYFIFDINSKKENEINHDFLEIIHKKYQL